MTLWRIYSMPVGRPGTAHYKPREDFGTIDGDTEMRALDNLCARIGQPRIPRTRSIAVMGIGSLKVEKITPSGDGEAARSADT